PAGRELRRDRRAARARRLPARRRALPRAAGGALRPDREGVGRMSERKDMELIAELVPRGSRVLDLGCGTGELLAHLRDVRGCSGYGVEIADANVLACTQRGVNVIQLNLEEG